METGWSWIWPHVEREIETTDTLFHMIAMFSNEEWRISGVDQRKNDIATR